MTNKEARIGEAITSLTTRLETWGVDEAREKAHAYVHDMLRHGWRPDGYRHNPPPAKPLNVTPASPDVLATLRGLVSSAKARLCPCGVEPMLCADHDPRKTSEGETP